MRIELEWLPLVFGQLVGVCGLLLAVYGSARRANLFVGSVLAASGLGPAIVPGHGEWVVVQAARLLFAPHLVAVAIGLGFVLVWSVGLYAVLSTVRRRRHLDDISCQS